jgi:hypothetical protein
MKQQYAWVFFNETISKNSNITCSQHNNGTMSHWKLKPQGVKKTSRTRQNPTTKEAEAAFKIALDLNRSNPTQQVKTNRTTISLREILGGCDA